MYLTVHQHITLVAASGYAIMRVRSYVSAIVVREKTSGWREGGGWYVRTLVRKWVST